MNPQVQQAIDNINQFIVENHNNEITADVLNPILIEIANLWGELVGDLSDSSVDGDTIIEMINQLQQNIEDVTGLIVHTGQPDPNVTPPTTYSAPDLYVRLTPSNIPYEVYIYNGIRWVLIDSGITKISEQWASYVLTGIGGLPILPQINENNRNINITGNPTGLSSLGGFVASGGASIANFWDGMTAKVLNSSPNNQTIKHSYSGADIKYLFTNEEDYTIRPNEVVYFDLKGGNLVFRYSTFLNAKNVFFDNTGSILSANDTEDAIKEIAERSLLKLESNLTFEVGYDKEFTSVKEAIDQALNYYPNADYKISILIDAGFEITEQLYYINNDLSHIVISSTGTVYYAEDVSAATFLTATGCWMPVFNNLDLEVKSDLTNKNLRAFVLTNVFSLSIVDSRLSSFAVGIRFNSSFANTIENTDIEIYPSNTSIGLDIQDSQLRLVNSVISSLNTSNTPLSNHRGIFLNGASFLNMANPGSVPGTTGGFYGNFTYYIRSQGQSSTYVGNIHYDIPQQYHFYILTGGSVLDVSTESKLCNIIPNIISKDGFYRKTTVEVPFDFDGTSYRLELGEVTIDDLAAPSGQEYNVTVDDTGKLKSEAKPTPQGLDSVLEQGNTTDKTAKFVSGDKFTNVDFNGVTVADEDSGALTNVLPEGIELQKTEGSGKAKIEGHTGSGNYTHTLQPKSGILAHIGDLVVFNQNPLDSVTVTGTTSSTTLLDVSSGTLTLSESDLQVGKTYEFQIYGKYTSSGDDFKLRFGVGASYVEITIPVSGTATNLPFRIIGSLDIVAVGGSPDAREYYFTGTIIRERSTTIIYEYPIVGNETVDDVTLGNDFTFSVVPTDNSSSFTCTKAILKRLN